MCLIGRNCLSWMIWSHLRTWSFAACWQQSAHFQPGVPTVHSGHGTGLKAGTQKGSVTMNNIRGTPWTGTRLWIALRTKKSEKDYWGKRNWLLRGRFPIISKASKDILITLNTWRLNIMLVSKAVSYLDSGQRSPFWALDCVPIDTRAALTPNFTPWNLMKLYNYQR